MYPNVSTMYPCPYFNSRFFPWNYKTCLPMRWSIFCITAMCAGYPALIWAFSVLYHHHKSKGQISFIAIFLLLSDLLELILNSIVVTFMLSVEKTSSYWNFKAFCLLFFGARLCGHLFHALVALESILTPKYPSLAFLFSAPYSITLCIIVLVVVIGCQFTPQYIYHQINILFLVLPLFVHVATCVVTCKASADTNQTADRKPGVLIVSVAMFTLIILYVPFFLNCYISLPFTVDLLVYMRLISEPLLCVLICRENHFMAKQ